MLETSVTGGEASPWKPGILLFWSISLAPHVNSLPRKSRKQHRLGKFTQQMPQSVCITVKIK